jgi:tRNA (guanine37-N1)-methyltransferase
MHFHVITTFPEVCKAYTDASILGRAQKTEKGKGAKVRGKKIEVSYYNPRDFTTDKHHKVDGRPYGGGPGMVLFVEPILRAWEKAVGRKRNKRKVKTIILSPRGRILDTAYAKKLAATYDHLVLVSGRYEGIDERVKIVTKAEEVSIGNFVLTSGDLPALALIDTVARQIPGVLGTFESLEEERETSGKAYARPEVVLWKGKKYRVPEVLVGGDHAQIAKWRASMEN